MTKGGEAPFQRRVPGAQNVDHVTIEGGGHFLQEDKPSEFAGAIIDFIKGSGT